MGDRGNIVMNYGDQQPEIYFYTHWRGSDLKAVVKEALIRGKPRWEDDSYLARIVFDTLTAGDRGTTGYGIAPFLTDNEHDLMVIHPHREIVEQRQPSGTVVQSWTFTEFIGWGLKEATDEK